METIRRVYQKTIITGVVSLSIVPGFLMWGLSPIFAQYCLPFFCTVKEVNQKENYPRR